MNIGILGSGEVGRTLATSLVALGHQVVLGSRTPNEGRAAAWVELAGPRGRAAQHETAARESEVLINALKGPASLEVIPKLPDSYLAGKIMIDIANDLIFPGPVPVVNMPQTDSLAERIQRAAPGLRVVKALNTMNARVMVAPRTLPERHDLLIAGNDTDAKARVSEFMRDWFGWETVIDLGTLESARGLEAYLGLWIRLRLHLGTSMFNIHVVTEKEPTDR